MKKIRVLHIINSLDIGGAEMLLVNSLATGGLPEMTENTLAYLGGQATLVNKLDKSVEVRNLNYKGIRSMPRVIKQLRNIVKEQGIEIVHSHLNPAGFYTRFGLPDKLPQVHTLHTCYSKDVETRPVLRYLERKILFRHPRTHLVFLSEYLREDFLQKVNYKGGSSVLPNFIGDEFFNYNGGDAKKPNGFRLVAVGNLKEVKNYSYLIEAFRYLKNDDISLDIYGEGSGRAHYQLLINRYNVNVNLKGQNMNLAPVFGDYDLFIMASTFEGYPLSVLEAMAAGLPVMLSDIAPLRDLAKTNAIFFPLNNPSRVAELIRGASQDEQGLKRMAENGKRLAAKMARKELYFERLLGIYHTVLKR